MKSILILFLFTLSLGVFAQRRALNTSTDQDPSPWPICQNFDEEENFYHFLCHGENIETRLSPIPTALISEYRDITYNVKREELYRGIKQQALDAADAQISKVNGYLSCLRTENPASQVSIVTPSGSSNLNCNNVRIQLINDLHDVLPQYRTFAALRGQSQFHHIYNTELSFGLGRDLDDMQRHRRRLEAIYEDSPLSEREMSLFMESSELFSTVPQHDIRSRDLPHIPLTPRELEHALNTYKTAQNINGDSVGSLEQEWLRSVAENPRSPHHRCSLPDPSYPGQYRFPSYHIESERELAIECGNEYFSEPINTGGIGPIDTTGERYKVKRASAFYSFLQSSNSRRTSYGVNREIHELWNEDYQRILSQNPYLGYLQLTSEDLIDESELDDEALVQRKIQHMQNKLHQSFTRLLQGVRAARAELERKDSLRDFMPLEALIPQYLSSIKPLTKADCDVMRREYDISDRNEAILDWGLMGLSIVGGISCPFTFGIGCAVTLASEGTNIYRTQANMRSMNNQFLTGNVELEDYLSARSAAGQTIMMAPLSLVGLPVISSSARAAKLFPRIAQGTRDLFRRPNAPRAPPSSVASTADDVASSSTQAAAQSTRQLLDDPAAAAAGDSTEAAVSETAETAATESARSTNNVALGAADDVTNVSPPLRNIEDDIARAGLSSDEALIARSTPRRNDYANLNRNMPNNEDSFMSRFPDLDEDTASIYSYAPDLRAINSARDKTVRELAEHVVRANRLEKARLERLAQKYASEPLLREAFERAASQIKTDLDSDALAEIGDALFNPSIGPHLKALSNLESAVIGAQGELAAMVRTANVSGTSRYIGDIFEGAEDTIRASGRSVNRDQMQAYLGSEIDILADSGNTWVEVKNFARTITADSLTNGLDKKLFNQLRRQSELREIFGITEGSLQLHATAGGITREAADLLRESFGVQAVGIVP